ncbi:hypothetical protein HK102_001786 [Quaeritorhiza haematococci]|nr:hypothetical protein HK102_001786 [Quaeritorhiza haematococci]
MNAFASPAAHSDDFLRCLLNDNNEDIFTAPGLVNAKNNTIPIPTTTNNTTNVAAALMAGSVDVMNSPVPSLMGSPMIGSPMMGSPSMMGSPLMGSPLMGSPMMHDSPCWSDVVGATAASNENWLAAAAAAGNGGGYMSALTASNGLDLKSGAGMGGMYSSMIDLDQLDQALGISTMLQDESVLNMLGNDPIMNRKQGTRTPDVTGTLDAHALFLGRAAEDPFDSLLDSKSVVPPPPSRTPTPSPSEFSAASTTSTSATTSSTNDATPSGQVTDKKQERMLKNREAADLSRRRRRERLLRLELNCHSLCDENETLRKRVLELQGVLKSRGIMPQALAAIVAAQSQEVKSEEQQQQEQQEGMFVKAEVVDEPLDMDDDDDDDDLFGGGLFGDELSRPNKKQRMMTM